MRKFLAVVFVLSMLMLLPLGTAAGSEKAKGEDVELQGVLVMIDCHDNNAVQCPVSCDHLMCLSGGASLGLKTGDSEEIFLLRPGKKQQKRVRLLNMGLEHATMMADMHLSFFEMFTGIKGPDFSGAHFRTAYESAADLVGSKVIVKGKLYHGENGASIELIKIRPENGNAHNHLGH